MNIVEAIVERKLKINGIERPQWKTKHDFKTIKFVLKDPVTDEIVKEYTYDYNNYLELPYEQKRKLQKLERSEVIDEEAYDEFIKEYDKVSKDYDVKFAEELLLVLKSFGIENDCYKRFTAVRETLADYFGNDFYDKDDRYEMEEELLCNICDKQIYLINMLNDGD